MKKRQRTPPTNPYYSNEPAVSTKLMADRPLVQNASLGSKTPKTVPHKPGRMSGIAGFADSKKPRDKKMTPISAAAPAKTKGAFKPPQLKASGHPKAHRVGLKQIKLKGF